MMERAALVTSATRGIGAAIAVRLARDGFDVALNYASRKEGALHTLNAVEDLGRKAIAIQADVSRATEARRLVAETVAGLGRLDVLVNKAGVYERAFLDDRKPEEIAAAVAFLASPDAACVAGQVLHVNAGSALY